MNKKNAIISCLLAMVLLMTSFVIHPLSASAASFSPQWPCQSTYVSTYYRYWNYGNPNNHLCRSNFHNGIDIAGKTGESIYATEAGTVIEIGYQRNGFGNYIVIKHDNGLCSLYAHLKSIAVRKGVYVAKGRKIGQMGSTGNSSGTHVHYELYNPNNRNQVTDPLMSYFSGLKLTIGGNSYKANSRYITTDSYARNWCSYLSTRCTKKSNGDYESKTIATSANKNTQATTSRYSVSFTAKASGYYNCYSKYSGSYIGRIFDKDQLKIQEIQIAPSGVWARGLCPWDRGVLKTVYFPLTNFKFTAQRYITAYDSASNQRIGRVYPGDELIVKDAKVNNGILYLNVLCPWDNGSIKSIWIKTTEI